MENQISYKIAGKYALFTDPITKIGGEKSSYHIPTYQALKGITESIYWKPTFIWIIDEVRVIKPIRTEERNVKPLKFSGGNELSIYTYLVDVEYEVLAHFIWNVFREDMINDRNDNKHYFCAKRMIKKGGRRDVFLGSRECQGYVEPCDYGKTPSYYDHYDQIHYSLMFHGFDYPDEVNSYISSSEPDMLYARFWKPSMNNGVIKFVSPENCVIKKAVRKLKPELIQTSGLKEKALLDEISDEGGCNELDTTTGQDVR